MDADFVWLLLANYWRTPTSFFAALLLSPPNAMDLAGTQKSETARRIVLYGSAYKLAWEQVPPDQKRWRPDISLRIHASIRRELKAGSKDPHAIASAALEDIQDK